MMWSLSDLLASIDRDEALSSWDEIAAWPAEAVMFDYLEHVLGEARSSRRRSAIDLLFTEDCVLVTPDKGLIGRDALSEWVAGLLARHPGCVFNPMGRVAAHNDMACQRWSFGPRRGTPIRIGTDFALLDGDRIRALYRFPLAVPKALHVQSHHAPGRLLGEEE